MSPWPRIAVVLLPLTLAAQGVDTPGKAWFLHLGINKVDTAASGFTPVAEVGFPIYRSGHSCLGMFGGGTQWTRAAYTADEMRAGDLLQKRAGWAGLYGSGDFLTLGLGAEYARAETYVVPAAGNGWYDNLIRNRAGAMGFISLHGRNGLGGFIRYGNQSGIGFGLSLNF